uniref:Uncharacterized protein n=1 Tax=Panagrolaimus sp. JU765 TaxID=591449 RepID=A0AC34QVP1_9BILA
MDGVISHIYLRDTNRTTPLEKFKELLCLKGEKFTVYSMETTPRRHHYTNNPRIGEVVLEAVPGIEIISKSRFDKFHDGGTHGYDNREPSMRAIFGALGPSFKKKFVIRPFQNIELYNFMSEAMRLSTPAPNNDHLWFLEQTRLPAPKGFIEGIWTEFATLLGKYRRHYKTLRMFAGPIYDQNNDGIADEIQQKPTHIFVILLRCSIGTKWKSDFANCEDPTSTRVLSFALPIVEKDFNCLYPIEYLYRNTLRIRDVELLTGLEFFTDRQIYSDEVAISLRTFITESLWQLEQQNSDHH